MIDQAHPKVLFLTTQDPSTIVAEWPYYQNWTLPQALEDKGVSVSKLCWQDPNTTPEKLATFDIISLLWCNNYHAYAQTFIEFLRDVLVPATRLSPRLRVVNHAGIVLWNVDKEMYLQDLMKHGFLISDTTFVPDAQNQTLAELQARIAAFAGDAQTPVVLKPSISGSSKMTHLIRGAHHLSRKDQDFLQSIIDDGIDGSLLIQRYEPGIEGGEYSMVFINGLHTHTMVKTPCKGEFRCQAEFGGGIAEIPAHVVPKNAIEVAGKVIKHLERKFPSGSNLKGGAVYARVDGVIRSDGRFVLMEVEAIEPHLWLETTDTPGCKAMLHAALLGEQVGPVVIQKKDVVAVKVYEMSEHVI